MKAILLYFVIAFSYTDFPPHVVQAKKIATTKVAKCSTASKVCTKACGATHPKKAASSVKAK